MVIHCIGCGKPMNQGDPAPARKPLCNRCILVTPPLNVTALEQLALLERRGRLLEYLDRLYQAEAPNSLALSALKKG